MLKDNQIGETNFYSTVSPALAVNNYNYIPSLPACADGQHFTTACYDPSAEFGYGILDVPHRMNIAPIDELPFGDGKGWAQGGVLAPSSADGRYRDLFSLQSGFPINVQQTADSRLGGQNANRPNLTGEELATEGDLDDRLASADHPTATWVNFGGIHLGGPRHVRQYASHAHRRPHAAAGQPRCLLHQEHPPGGAKTAQFQMEVINVLNRPNVRTLQGQNGSATRRSAGRTRRPASCPSVPVHVPLQLLDRLRAPGFRLLAQGSGLRLVLVRAKALASTNRGILRFPHPDRPEIAEVRTLASR